VRTSRTTTSIEEQARRALPRPVRLDRHMGPTGMAEMSGKVTPAASDQPGLYGFSIGTGMAGKWELVLTAKVPGEVAPITGKVIYDAR
jgi:hypothetical protein